MAVHSKCQKYEVGDAIELSFGQALLEELKPACSALVPGVPPRVCRRRL